MNRRFYQTIQFVLIYTLFVIVWGAFVRASGSGAGCGSHWPLCNGVVLPREPSLQTQIEFFHRLSSGLTLPLILWIGYRARKILPENSFGRKMALLAVVSIFIEALIGAGLVLFELVTHDQSLKRVVSICLHFTNTLVLTAALVLTAQSVLRNGKGWIWESKSLKTQSWILSFGFFALGMAGAITALGDTLFPAQSLTEGLKQDLALTSHIAIRLRFLHPLFAIGFGLFYTPWVWNLVRFEYPQHRRLGLITMSLVCFNICLGIINILYLAPIPLQLFHLTVALCVWVSFVLFIDRIASDHNSSSLRSAVSV